MDVLLAAIRTKGISHKLRMRRRPMYIRYEEWKHFIASRSQISDTRYFNKIAHGASLVKHTRVWAWLLKGRQDINLPYLIKANILLVN